MGYGEAKKNIKSIAAHFSIGVTIFTKINLASFSFFVEDVIYVQMV